MKENLSFSKTFIIVIRKLEFKRRFFYKYVSVLLQSDLLVHNEWSSFREMQFFISRIKVRSGAVTCQVKGYEGSKRLRCKI